jgi:hypothetical protein
MAGYLFMWGRSAALELFAAPNKQSVYALCHWTLVSARAFGDVPRLQRVGAMHLKHNQMAVF